MRNMTVNMLNFISRYFTILLDTELMQNFLLLYSFSFML